MNVAVVGAGITGLVAAWELRQGDSGADVAILESERRAGGVIVTEHRDGFVIEAGPDGWLAAEPDIPALAAELGVSDRIVHQAARGSSLWTGDRFQPLAEGGAAALLGIATKDEDLAAGFSSFAGGMGTLVEALLERVGLHIRSPAGVSAVVPAGSRWRLTIAGGSSLEADAVVLASPAYVAGRLLEQAGAHGARHVSEVMYFPSVTVSLAYRATQIGAPLTGTGFVVAEDRADTIRACTYASEKFAGRAPSGHVLLRVFLTPEAGTGEGNPADLAHQALSPILAITGKPLWSRVFSWPRGIPRYSPRHGERVAALRARLARLVPPLAIAGAGYDGAGVSACVRSGRDAGKEIRRRLSR